MRRPIPVLVILALAAVAAVAAYLLGTGSPGESPPPSPSQPPVPAPASVPAPRPLRMDFVRFPGGRATVGLTRADFQDLVRGSVLGRMKGVEDAVEAELSPSVGEHAVDLPSFLLGRCEVTNAQYREFLKAAGRVEVVIPPAGEPGPRTLEEVSWEFPIGPVVRDRDGKEIHPVAVDGEGLYDLNEEALNPAAADGKRARERAEFLHLPLPPGLRLVAWRHTVPRTWSVTVRTADGKERKRLEDHPGPGTLDLPVTGIALTDAVAFAAHYGCHVPTEEEWEACARGPRGEPWPTGAFEPLGMAWSGFNMALLREQLEAGKGIDGVREGLAAADRAQAAGGTDPLSAEERSRSERLLARWEWVLGAEPIEEPYHREVPVFPVGGFPLGRSPCGALDMIGNADEWVSTPFRPWPGTDSRSMWLRAVGFVLRGGNALDRDIFISAPIRKFLVHMAPIPASARYATLGFRVARYDMPGASAALPAVQAAERADPPVLPGHIDPGTGKPVRTGLDIRGAAGIGTEAPVPGDGGGPRVGDFAADPLLLLPARSLCVVPADGISAADLATPDAAGRPRGSRDLRHGPFLGLLHLTDGVAIRAEAASGTSRYVPGTVRGGDHPGGLFLGMTERDGRMRAALWEARVGRIPSTDPEGSVLFEDPVALLAEDAIAFREVAERFAPAASFDPATGRAALVLFVPVAGRIDGIEVRVHLQVARDAAVR